MAPQAEFHTDFPYRIRRASHFGWQVVMDDSKTVVQHCSTLERARTAVARLEHDLYNRLLCIHPYTKR